jgi:Mor family transcriptional regulator
MKDDLLAEWTAYGVRVLMEVGYPAIEAHVQAELVTAAIIQEIQGTQTYVPRAALTRLRNQAIRETYWANRASVDDLAHLAGLSKAQMYRVISRRRK